MTGMIQVLTYLLGIYLVVKGVGVLQLALCSTRPNRAIPMLIGLLTLGVCVVAAVALVNMQDEQARSIGATLPRIGQ